MARTVRIAHSPDADDAFMFYGLSSGAVTCRDLAFELVTADIETLNQRALTGELDVTAVSFAAWPLLADRYDLLSVGSSFGRGYGPKVVARAAASREELTGKVVAIPGAMTTAALVLQLWVPGVTTRVVPFERIPESVLSGEVDAGVVIHEAQLTFSRDGLALVQDLGAWWGRKTRGLPLPLGGNAIRRDLPSDVTVSVREALRESVQHALDHRRLAVEHAMQFGRGLDDESAGQYVAMYVNELTLDPGPSGRAAVEELYRQGWRAGLLPAAVEPTWA